MTEADGDNSAAWVSAEAALEPWFESDCKFEDLPSELQALFRRGEFPIAGFVPYLWNESGPQRRREIARQRDFKTHPDLAEAQEAVFQAVGEVNDRRRVATAKRLEDRDARDVIAQRQDVREAEGHLRAAEVTLDAMARRLGLTSRKLAAPTPLLKPVTSADLPEWLTGLQAVTWILLKDAAVVLAAGPGGSRERVPRTAGPLDAAQAEAADPAAWGGVSDYWLAIRVGNAETIFDAEASLLLALRAGKVRSVLTDEALPADGWARLRLHFDQAGKQIFAAWHSDLMQGQPWAIPMFSREDILAVWPDEIEPEAEANPTSPSARSTQRRSRQGKPILRTDYGKDDEPLLIAMRASLTSTPPTARNPWDAALKVAGQAKGIGAVESKAKRLTTAYKTKFTSEHD